MYDQVLDMKQQGYPDWFRGLRLILTLVNMNQYKFKCNQIFPGCGSFLAMQPWPLHGDWHQATAEHSPHLIHTVPPKLDLGESLIISGLVEYSLDICFKVVVG